jgi:hypothetical protein
MLAEASLPPKGRGDQLGQRGRLDSKAVSKPAASVFVGRGWRGPSTGAGLSAVANTLCPGGENTLEAAKRGNTSER